MPAVPDRTHRVNHSPSWKPVALRDLRSASLATTQPTTLLKQSRPCDPVDRSINAPSPQQRGIRRIDNRINLKGGYVGLNGSKHCHTI